jgi:hypothetical protein
MQYTTSPDVRENPADTAAAIIAGACRPDSPRVCSAGTHAHAHAQCTVYTYVMLDLVSVAASAFRACCAVLSRLEG